MHGPGYEVLLFLHRVYCQSFEIPNFHYRSEVIATVLILVKVLWIRDTKGIDDPLYIDRRFV